MVRKVEHPTKTGSGKDQGRQAVSPNHDDSNNEEAWFVSWALKPEGVMVSIVRVFILLLYGRTSHNTLITHNPL